MHLRYSGSNRNRIFVGDSVNWMHGFHAGRNDVVNYGWWKIWREEPANDDTVLEWVRVCAQNGSPEGADETVLINGVDITPQSEGGASPGRLWTNNRGAVPMTSDFEISEVIIYDRWLSLEEMRQVDSSMVEGTVPEKPVCMHHEIAMTDKILYTHTITNIQLGSPHTGRRSVFGFSGRRRHNR